MIIDCPKHVGGKHVGGTERDFKWLLRVIQQEAKRALRIAEHMTRVGTKTNCALGGLQSGKNARGEGVQCSAARLEPGARVFAKQSA